MGGGLIHATDGAVGGRVFYGRVSGGLRRHCTGF